MRALCGLCIEGRVQGGGTSYCLLKYSCLCEAGLIGMTVLLTHFFAGMSASCMAVALQCDGPLVLENGHGNETRDNDDMG